MLDTDAVITFSLTDPPYDPTIWTPYSLAPPMATVHADLLNWLASQMLGKYKADITHSAIYIAFDDHSHAALFKLFWLDSIMDEVAYAGAID